jgi:hypothetical protein
LELFRTEGEPISRGQQETGVEPTARVTEEVDLPLTAGRTPDGAGDHGGSLRDRGGRERWDSLENDRHSALAKMRLDRGLQMKEVVVAGEGREAEKARNEIDAVWLGDACLLPYFDQVAIVSSVKESYPCCGVPTLTLSGLYSTVFMPMSRRPPSMRPMTVFA